MSVQTINGKRMSEETWNKAFSKALKTIVGDGYQTCEYDRVDARLLWRDRIDPRRAAEQIAKRRYNQASRAEVLQVRVWRDEFDKSIQVRGEIDPGTMQVVGEMFERGQREGVFMLWRAVTDRRINGDVEPALVKWSAL